ncbi:MAG: iron ABC transporter [Clostridiales bacterium 38-18]|nr:MAG: iron ABC transporter [Clostridiales bacterium 38-18]
MMRKKLTVLVTGSILLLVFTIFISLAFGARNIPFKEVIEILGSLMNDAMNNETSNTMNALVLNERIPRTLFGLLAGAALGVSGALMQSVTRNPIADPSILGVNTGASLLVVLGIAFFNVNTSGAYILFALIGAALTTIFVYGIGSLGSGGATPIKLALAGAATSAALSSLVSAVILPRVDVMNAFRFWQVGSISGGDWSKLAILTPVVGFALLLGFIVTPALDALSLGDDVATGLGVNTRFIRLIATVSGVVLCGATTAFAGPIGFVGLMVPHVIRLFSGPNLKIIIPFSAIGGAVLLTVSDVIGRLIGSPGELEAGIVTAFIGAPVLIIIAMKAKVRTL